MKLGNDYAGAFGKLYTETPKAVFAAIAYSMCFIDSQEDEALTLQRFKEEWRALHQNGIVPQAPPKEFAKDIEHEKNPVFQGHTIFKDGSLGQIIARGLKRKVARKESIDIGACECGG